MDGVKNRRMLKGCRQFAEEKVLFGSDVVGHIQEKELNAFSVLQSSYRKKERSAGNKAEEFGCRMTPIRLCQGSLFPALPAHTAGVKEA